MNAHSPRRRLAFFGLSVVLSAATIQAQEVKHSITFTFDYDFSQNPACSVKVKQACVQQFVFYDISQGVTKRIKLGSITVPAGATGLVKRITATSDSLLFNSGRHTITVSAQMADGSESDLTQCATTVRIP